MTASIVASAAWVYFFAHLYLAMRAVYGQSHVRTSLKYVALGMSYVGAAVLTWFGAAIFTAVTV